MNDDLLTYYCGFSRGAISIILITLLCCIIASLGLMLDSHTSFDNIIIFLLGLMLILSISFAIPRPISILFKEQYFEIKGNIFYGIRTKRVFYNTLRGVNIEGISFDECNNYRALFEFFPFPTEIRKFVILHYDKGNFIIGCHVPEKDIEKFYIALMTKLKEFTTLP